MEQKIQDTRQDEELLDDPVLISNRQEIAHMRVCEPITTAGKANYAMDKQRIVGNITIKKESHKERTGEKVGDEHGYVTPRLDQGKQGEQARDNRTLGKRKRRGDLSMPSTTSYTRRIHGTKWAKKCDNIMRRKRFNSAAVTSLLQILIVFSFLSRGVAGGPCQSPQYLQLGSSGVVNCSFQGDFLAIAWFNSTSILDEPLVTMRDDGKSGEEFGEFDIAENRSLLIRNVSLQHDHTFCVATVVAPRDNPPTYCVDVVTVVFPEQKKPLITDVRNCSDGVCFAQYLEDSIIRCFVENARPAVNLTWAVRSGSTDRTISHQSLRVPSLSIDGTFSSYVTLGNPFMYSETLALAVCKAISQSNVLNRNESLILLQNMASDLPHVTPVPLYAAVDSTVVLNCPIMEENILVWNRKRDNPLYMDMVAYAIYGERPSVSLSGEMYTLNPDGSLVISEVSVESRGTYICLAGYGENEKALSYDVHVYASAFPKVEGCGSQGYCVLLAEEHDRLTCVLRGVIEGVRLGFTPLSPQEASISFLEQVVEIRDAGDFVDVSVTVTYQASGSGVSVLQCGVIGEHKELFSQTAVFSLYVETAINTTPETNYKYNIWENAFIVLVGFLFGVLAMKLFLYLRSVGRRDTPSKTNAHGDGQSN